MGNASGNEPVWCPATLIESSQIINYYNQIVLADAIKGNWTLPNAIYLDALDVGGVIRTGAKALSTPPSTPVCHVFKYTSCKSEEDAKKPGACDPGYVLDTETREGFPANKEHFNAYDSFGEKHGFCFLPKQDHWKCCRVSEDSSRNDEAAFAYVDTLILYNVVRSCSSGRTSASKAVCQDLENRYAARAAAHPVQRWDSIVDGRRSSWPK